jgi:hypothetical protein
MPFSTAELWPHPANAVTAIRRIRAGIVLDALAAELRISFRMEGDIRRLQLPEKGAALRSDGLWQHSCFEAFLRPDADNSYYEFNFSPSGDWALYSFSARRDGRQSPEMPAPQVDFRRSDDNCDMSAVVSLAPLAALAHAPFLSAGLAAVIEDRHGGLTHWALAHRGDAPDFHDPATFTLRVTPR